MKKINQGPWLLNVDIERTRQFYEQFYLITDSCACDSCIHYVEQCATFSEDTKAFFSMLAIDPSKEGEVFVIMENEDGTETYSAFYHIVGEIVDGPSSEADWVVHKDFTFHFTTKLDLVPEDFPTPIIQVQLEMNLPKGTRSYD